MKFYIYVMSPGCPACDVESQAIDDDNKLSVLDLEEDRFMLLNLTDPGHLAWIELLQPISTPCLYVIESGTLAIKQEFRGAGCFDATMKYLNIFMPWNPTAHIGDVASMHDVPTEVDKTVIENDPDSQEVV